jgi:hypothetical protein
MVIEHSLRLVQLGVGQRQNSAHQQLGQLQNFRGGGEFLLNGDTALQQVALLHIGAGYVVND